MAQRSKGTRPKTTIASESSVPMVLPQSYKASGADVDEESQSNEVWVRLSAFLSMRSPNTQITYRGIIQEWLAFLRVEPGTALGARAIQSATDVHAIAYRNWLIERPGERPRMSVSSERHTDRNTDENSRRERSLLVAQVETQQVEIQSKSKRSKISSHGFAQQRTGLEHTQANATIAKKLSALRRVYRMLVGAGLLKRNPFDSDQVPPPSKDAGKKRPTEMIDFALVKKLLQQPDTKTPKGARDAAVLAVLFGGALRRSEAVGLRVGDVRKTPSGTTFLYLRSTKAKRDAEQALPAFAAKVMWSLVSQRKQEGAQSGDFLFISYTGRGGAVPTKAPLTSSGLYKLFRFYCARAGISEHITPHSARATAITKLLADGVPHGEVKDFSRHSSVQMVEAYDKRRKSVDTNPGKDLDFDD